MAGVSAFFAQTDFHDFVASLNHLRQGQGQHTIVKVSFGFTVLNGIRQINHSMEAAIATIVIQHLSLCGDLCGNPADQQ